MEMPWASAGGDSRCLDIVGRRVERECLRQAVEAVTSGRGGVVVVAGEPGIGKSKLLAAARSEARAAELPTLMVAPPSRPQPWTDLDPARASYGADVHGILEHVTGAERMVVIADDVHTVRPEQMPGLSELLGSSMTGPVLLVMAYRPRQIPYALGALLTRTSDAGALRTLTLAALDVPEARDLLGDRPDLEDLHRLGAGNPLYMQALADPWGPASIALLGEMSALRPAELQLAQIAAVLGDHFTATLLTAVAPVDAERTTAALDGLIAADIVRPADLSPQLAFRHPVLARVVYDRIGISQRRAIHLRVEAALAESNATAAQRSRHVARAADPAVPGHVETLLEGARETLESDPASAAEWLATACVLMVESHPRWAEAQLLLARAQLLRGSPGESRRVLHELLPRAEAPTLMSSAAVYYGQADRLLGRPSEARALFEKALVDEAGSGSGDSMTIHTEIADIAVEVSDFSSATHHATIAADIARRLGDRIGEAGALSVAALAHLYAGQADAAEQTAATAAQLVDAMSDTALISNLACLNWLGMTEAALERLPDAERHLARGLALSVRTGQTHVKPDLLKSLADVRLRLGNLAQAVDTIAEARAAAAHDIALSALVETMYAEALLWQANDPAAIAAAERAVALCEGATTTWAMVTRVSSADVLIRAGQADRGSRMLTSAAGGPLLPRLPAVRRARWWESLVVAATSRGDVETAAHLTKHAIADPEARPFAARRGYILRAQMHTAGLQADTSLAARLAASAGECFATAHLRLEVGRTLLDVTRICLDAGETTGVDARLDEARDLAMQCGSQRLLDEVEHLHRQADQLAADDADTQLTDRELQVAMLARTGMRSKDIASQLFVSVRTIDTHLSRIYRKLGISTRTELARASLGRLDTLR